VTRTTGAAPAWRLTTPAGASLARALVGGPRTATGSVSATVHVTAGGVALIAQQTSPGQALVAELAPDQPARLVQLGGGAAQPLCTATAAPTVFDPATPAVDQLAITGGQARLSIDGAAVLACRVAAGERGAWGIASLGAGAQLTVDSVTVAR